MKSVIKPTKDKQEHLDTSKMTNKHLSSFLSASTKVGSTTLQMHSEVHTRKLTESVQELPTQLLSKSLEKTFLRMKDSSAARDAYVQAEVVTALAHQIRSVRVQRGWSQLELAKKLGTTQTAVSRLEDPSYGKFTLKTLLDLSKVFDAGLQVKFVSFMTLLSETYFVKAKTRQVPAFADESTNVAFYSNSNSLPTQVFSQDSEGTKLIEINVDRQAMINKTFLNLKNPMAQTNNFRLENNWS